MTVKCKAEKTKIVDIWIENCYVAVKLTLVKGCKLVKYFGLFSLSSYILYATGEKTREKMREIVRKGFATFCCLLVIKDL